METLLVGLGNVIYSVPANTTAAGRIKKSVTENDVTRILEEEFRNGLRITGTIRK